MTTATTPAPPRADQGSGTTSRAGELRLRLIGLQASDRLWGWLGPLLVTALAGFLRLWHLDRPATLVFDETYYVKQGVSMLQSGYEKRVDAETTPGPDERFVAGTPDVFLDVPDFVVHPPVGKWMIAAGEAVMGTTSPWGWRLTAALCGTLSVLILARVARRLFGSTLLGCTAGLLLAIDGQHLVHSRTALLDVFVMFWALAAFACLLIDRDQARRRLADRVAAALPPQAPPGPPLEGWGPGLGIRWWRVGAGVCLGLLCGVKWSGLWFVVVFGLMTVLWDLSARRAAGARTWWLVGGVRDGLSAFVQVVPVAVLTYLASWAGWFRSTDGYDRQWAAAYPSETFGWVPDALRSLWHYHVSMYDFHVGLATSHPYESNPWSWMVLGRPTAFFYQGTGEGVSGCEGGDCAQAVIALGNPVVWWGGTIAVVVLVGAWLLRRDWRAGAVLAGLAAGYLPWFAYQERTIYSFYAVAFVPWVVLGLTYCLGLLLGPRDAGPDRRLVGAAAAGAVVVLALVCFAWFYPVYVGEVIQRVQWTDRMWLPSWV